MPYSEPAADQNPIVKEPPLFTDTAEMPIEESLGEIEFYLAAGTSTYLFRATAYDAENEEIYTAQGINANTDLEIRVYDSSDIGDTVNPIRNFVIEDTGNFGDGNGPGDLSAKDGTLYVAVAADSPLGAVVLVCSGQTGAVEETIDFSAVFDPPNNGIYGMDVTESENIALFGEDSGDNFIYVETDGITNEVLHSFAGGDNKQRLAFYRGDDIVLSVISRTVRVYELDREGETITDLLTITFPFVPNPPASISGVGLAKRDGSIYALPCFNDNNGFNAVLLNNGDLGEAFTGNSGKVLEADKVYSFRITGPNSIATPTLNDDGQGAKDIVLPGYLDPPIGSIYGFVDLFFDGSKYIILSLTEEMAQAIYSYVADAGNSESLQAGTFANRPTADAANAGHLYISTDGDGSTAVPVIFRDNGGSWVEIARAVTEGAALTAQDTATVDTTYGAEEAGVIENNRTRIAEIEVILQSNGLAP